MLMSREFEEWSRLKYIAETSAYRIESKSLVVLQASCRSFLKKYLNSGILLTRSVPMLLYERNHGLRKILAMLKFSGLILHLSEGIGLREMVGV